MVVAGPLANVLGLPEDLVARALERLADERRVQRIAARVLAPYLNRAAENYWQEGERLKAAIWSQQRRRAAR